MKQHLSIHLLPKGPHRRAQAKQSPSVLCLLKVDDFRHCTFHSQLQGFSNSNKMCCGDGFHLNYYFGL